MPDLSTLYDLLAAREVILDGALVPAYTPDALPSALQSAHLPARLLLPQRGGARTILPRTLNGSRSMVLWDMTDLVLLTPLGQGRGVHDHAPLLMRCASAYRDALRVGWQFADGALLSQVSLTSGVFAYPDGGIARYVGIEARLTLRVTD